MAAKKRAAPKGAGPRRARRPLGAVVPRGVELLANDATANDSDKTFTVPAAEEWEVMSIFVTLVTTATVGARALVVEFRNASAAIFARTSSGVSQAASLTQHHTFAPAMNQSGGVAQLGAHSPIPQLVLPAGFDVRVYDFVAVDAAADDMTVRIFGVRRAV